jgi:hypothetical protein
MAVSVTWSLSNGGSAASDPVDHGDQASGDKSSGIQVYIAHDGENSLTNCRFWIGEKSDTYGGDFTAPADLAEMLEWGDATSSGLFGGFQVNMDTEGGFPDSWPEWDDKEGDYFSSFYTGHGDVAASGVLLSQKMSPEMTVDGIIPADMTTWPSFKARVQVPADESTTGVRQFDQRLRFTYSS